MDRKRPSEEDFERINQYRRRQQEQIALRKSGGTKPRDTMSLEDVKNMLKRAGKSGHKIPKKLLPKSPF